MVWVKSVTRLQVHACPAKDHLIPVALAGGLQRPVIRLVQGPTRVKWRVVVQILVEHLLVPVCGHGLVEASSIDKVLPKEALDTQSAVKHLLTHDGAEDGHVVLGVSIVGVFYWRSA